MPNPPFSRQERCKVRALARGQAKWRLRCAVRTLKTSEAAALLHVSPNTLRAWERRFDYPHPQRSPGKHRIYTYAEIATLKDALEQGLSISSAVSIAREAYGANAHALFTALTSFRPEAADEAMEASLSLRTVERSV